MPDLMAKEPASRRTDEVQGHEAAAVSLLDVAEFLVRNRRTLAVSIVVALSAAVIVLTMAKPLFTAKALLLIDARPPQLLRDQLGDASLSLDSAQVESQIAVLMSEQVAMIVIKRRNLQADPS